MAWAHMHTGINSMNNIDIKTALATMTFILKRQLQVSKGFKSHKWPHLDEVEGCGQHGDAVIGIHTTLQDNPAADDRFESTGMGGVTCIFLPQIGTLR